MQKYMVLYNPLSNNKKGEESAREAEKVFENGEFSYKSVLEIKSYAEYFKELSDEYTVVLAGGDGTLNKFVNNLNNEKLSRDVYYFPAGSGNDFMHDVSEDGKLKYIKLNPYVENLPTVEINGKKSLFINGIGFGSTEFHVLRPITSKSNPYWLYTLISFDSFRSLSGNSSASMLMPLFTVCERSRS